MQCVFSATHPSVLMNPDTLPSAYRETWSPMCRKEAEPSGPILLVVTLFVWSLYHLGSCTGHDVTQQRPGVRPGTLFKHTISSSLLHCHNATATLSIPPITLALKKQNKLTLFSKLLPMEHMIAD